MLGAGLEPLLSGGLTLLIYWYALYWMYRQKIFLRI
jgi:predicted acyltransferase